MLGLEREPVALAVHPAARADEGAVEEVARVELDSGLLRVDGERVRCRARTRAARISDLSFGFDRSRTQLWSYPRPITSWGCPSRMRSPMAVGFVKSSGVPATGSIAPVGINVSSTRRVLGRVELEHVVVDAARALALEIEVGVVRQVDDRRCIRGRLVVHDDLVLLGQRVRDLGRELARVALVAVGARELEDEPDGLQVVNGVAAQTCLSKPTVPPYSEFGGLLMGSWYVTPSSVNVPSAIRFAYRPVMQPKYGLLAT